MSCSHASRPAVVNVGHVERTHLGHDFALALRAREDQFEDRLREPASHQIAPQLHTVRVIGTTAPNRPMVCVMPPSARVASRSMMVCPLSR